MGLFTMKDRVEMIKRNVRVACLQMETNRKYEKANRAYERYKKKLEKEYNKGKNNLLFGLGYVGDEDAPSFLSPYDIYDIINKSYTDLNISDIKNVPVEGEKFDTSNTWDNSFKSLIRIIYTTLLYPNYDIDSVLDDDDIELWVSMMKDPTVGKDVAAFDQQNPGNVSLYGLIKKTNDILYMSYPDYEDTFLEAEAELHKENKMNPGGEKKIMLVKLPIVISKDGDYTSPLMLKSEEMEELEKIRNNIVSLIHEKYDEIAEEEEEEEDDDDDFDYDDDDDDDDNGFPVVRAKTAAG